jgi:magnesium-transporting ATPase (P-type)
VESKPCVRYQEKQAADVVAKLKGDIALKARVIRGGIEQDIKARDLVPGDIVSILVLVFALTQTDANLV